MRGGVLKLTAFMVWALAVVVSVEIAPDAAALLLARGEGDKNVRITDAYYICRGGNSFAVVRNGKPENAEDYDLVEAGELNVYAPKHMSYEGDAPRIVTFPRRSGARDVGVSNTKNERY